MNSPPPFMIRVPCSTSNLGPGFDVLGVALSMYITVDVTFGNNKEILILHKGFGEGQVPLDSNNLLISSANFLAKRVNCSLPNNINIVVHNTIPLGGGLGSSGAAIVAGVVLANHVLNLKLSKESLLSACVEIEGHPDNVTPAFIGGCVACCGIENSLSVSVDPFPPRSVYIPINVDKTLRFVAVSPEFHVSTAKARAVLPQVYPKKDVVFNLQHVAILVAGLASKNKMILREAMKDMVHQPYRSKLVPGTEKILSLAEDPELREYGLIGVTISGSGPTILAITDCQDDSMCLKIGEKIKCIFKENQLPSTSRLLSIDHNGAVVIPKSSL